MEMVAPPGDFAIPVLIGKVEHLVDVLLHHRHGQVPHHLLGIFLSAFTFLT